MRRSYLLPGADGELRCAVIDIRLSQPTSEGRQRQRTTDGSDEDMLSIDTRMQTKLHNAWNTVLEQIGESPTL